MAARCESTPHPALSRQFPGQFISVVFLHTYFFAVLYQRLTWRKAPQAPAHQCNSQVPNTSQTLCLFAITVFDLEISSNEEVVVERNMACSSNKHWKHSPELSSTLAFLSPMASHVILPALAAPRLLQTRGLRACATILPCPGRSRDTGSCGSNPINSQPRHAHRQAQHSRIGGDNGCMVELELLSAALVDRECGRDPNLATAVSVIGATTPNN